MKANIVEYELNTGDYVPMSITMTRLYRLSAKDKNLYKKMSKFLMKGPDEEDIIEVVQFLYGAYACGNVEDFSMTYEEFMEKMNEDIGYNMEVIRKLIKPGKK